MHYFSGEQGISADYFGLFCEGLKEKIAPEEGRGDFVAMMSHGCSGDIWRRDYTDPDGWDRLSKIEAYADGLVDLAAGALEGTRTPGRRRYRDGGKPHDVELPRP